MTHSAGVLIPSYRRVEVLSRCLDSLARQTRPPDHVVVIWQDDDIATRDAAESARGRLPFELRVLHSLQRGVVPAENVGLEASDAQIVLLIDDDATAPPDWIERHLRFYDDPEVGAVGGPAINHRPDGSRFPVRDAMPIGKLTWCGRTLGNSYDHPEAWLQRTPIAVDHVAGGNMSVRRCALDRFAEPLREYWQMFELEACLQVAARGFRVMFDFGNVVMHYPTNSAYAGGRQGNLQIKIYNAAYNHAWILARHTRGRLQRWARLSYVLGIGSVGTPGLVGAIVAIARSGQVGVESEILCRTIQSNLAGWRDGNTARRASRR